MTNYRECIKLITFVISRERSDEFRKSFFHKRSWTGELFQGQRRWLYTGELFSPTFRGERVDAYVIFRDVLGNIFSGKAAATKKKLTCRVLAVVSSPLFFLFVSRDWLIIWTNIKRVDRESVWIKRRSAFEQGSFNFLLLHFTNTNN